MTMRWAQLVCTVALLSGCASPPVARDWHAVAMDPQAPVVDRIHAVEMAWAGADGPERARLRDDLKAIVWEVRLPAPVRVAAAQAILQQDDAEMEKFARLRLPTEPSLAVLRELCAAAVRHGWTSATPALIRSYARPVDGVPDADRPERAALESLHPESTVVSTVVSVFLNPPAEADAPRLRRDAWALLARLDPSGEARAPLLAHVEGDPVVAAIQACRDELGVMPITGAELAWLMQLARTRDDANGWWGQCASIVSALPDSAREGLRLRHLEPLRRAKAHNPELLEASRDELLAIVRSRDDRRDHYRRNLPGSVTDPTQDRLRDWEDRLSWADLLTIIVVDDALRSSRTRAMLFAQADMDHADNTTEYGGLLTTDADGEPLARLYIPRARRGDTLFIARTDMIEEGAQSLAHYHFHAHDSNNSRYAGPSPGDLDYAARQGCTCVVLTSIAEGRLGVDLYQPDGAIVDLGELNAP